MTHYDYSDIDPDVLARLDDEITDMITAEAATPAVRKAVDALTSMPQDKQNVQSKSNGNNDMSLISATDIAADWENIVTHTKPPISTGYKRLDAELDGGLYPGLYVIGAIPSLGKTTLVSQISDYMASQGQPILFFSLEMAARELVGRSLSRETDTYVNINRIPYGKRKSYREISNIRYWQQYNDYDYTSVRAAVKQYMAYSDKISIVEGRGNMTINAMLSIVDQYISTHDTVPVIIIDYMQLIRANDIRMTDKQKLDDVTTQLKQISRDYDTPVIAISSLNRENYSQPISLTAFKESGGIEYGTDVVIGLEYTGIGVKDKFGKSTFDLNVAKSETPRKITAKILKNRSGICGRVHFRYYAQYSLFIDSVTNY